MKLKDIPALLVKHTKSRARHQIEAVVSSFIANSKPFYPNAFVGFCFLGADPI